MPSYVMDGMVLQQNKITTLNGSTAKSMSGKTVSVTLRGGKNQYNASSRISKAGTFSVQLPKIKGALTQYTMKFTVAGTVAKTVNDVYVGNLFIASGQSNMEINYNDYFESDSLFKTSTSLHYTRNDIPRNINDKYVHFLSPNKILDTKNYPLRDFEKKSCLQPQEMTSTILAIFLNILRNDFVNNIRIYLSDSSKPLGEGQLYLTI